MGRKDRVHTIVVRVVHRRFDYNGGMGGAEPRPTKACGSALQLQLGCEVPGVGFVLDFFPGHVLVHVQRRFQGSRLGCRGERCTAVYGRAIQAPLYSQSALQAPST